MPRKATPRLDALERECAQLGTDLTRVERELASARDDLLECPHVREALAPPVPAPADVPLWPIVLAFAAGAAWAFAVARLDA